MEERRGYGIRWRLGKYRWVFPLILGTGIVLNLMPVWCVPWLPMCDIGGWMELMDVMARYDDPSTLYSEYFELPTMPEPNILALYSARLLGRLVPIDILVKLLLCLYVVGLPLSILAMCLAFGRSKWLALFSVPMTYNGLVLMGFLNFLIAMPLVFSVIALARSYATRGRLWQGLLLALCFIVLYFAHVFGFLIGWSVSLAVLVLCSEPRRYHLRLLPMLTALPLFALWYWRMFVARVATEEGVTFGTEEGLLWDHPSLDAYFDSIHRWGMQLFRDSTDEVFVIALIVLWLLMIALSLGRPRLADERKGFMALLRRYSLELITLCCFVAYFVLPFNMHRLHFITERIVIISALLLSIWPHLEFDRWSQRALLVPLVTFSFLLPFFVCAQFKTFERRFVGNLPRAIADLPDRNRLGFVMWHMDNSVIHKGSVWHFAEGMNSVANGGITSIAPCSFASQPYTPIHYKKGKTPRTLPKRFWESPLIDDYDYVLLRRVRPPDVALKQRTKLRLVFNEGSWWLFEVLDPRDPVVRKRWAAGKDMVCKGPGKYCGANIVLITLDSVRHDHLGYNGYERRTSPRLDELSEESVVFDNAYSHASWTHPSMVSIMTGLHPNEHGVTLGIHKIKLARLMLAEVLQNKGYHTHAHVSHVLLKPSFRYRQGFDSYDFSVLDEGDPHEISSSKQISDRAIVALSTMPEPFFLWLHYFDPHFDYMNHSQFDFPGDRPFDRYDSEIAYTDHHVGRVLKMIESTGLSDRTIVVVVADHGQEFWEHGARHHSYSLHEELIHVPLLIKVPGIEHQRVEEVVVHSDIAPTLVHLVGIRVPKEFKGQVISFGPDGVHAESRVVFSETRCKSDMRCILKDGHKLIFNRRSGKIKLYDLREDPGEVHDLYESERTIADELFFELLEFYAGPPEEAEALGLEHRLTKKLRSLGYLD